MHLWSNSQKNAKNRALVIISHKTIILGKKETENKVLQPANTHDENETTLVARGCNYNGVDFPTKM